MIGISKKKNSGQLLMILIYLMLGAVCGLLMIMTVDSVYTDTLSAGKYLMIFALTLVFMYAAILLQIIIHESGHLVFGLLSGYGFRSFRIGSLILLKEENGVKLRRIHIAGTAGQCIMSPPDMKDGKIPYVLYNLGGSLMNLISSTVFILLSLLFSDIMYLSLFMKILFAVGIFFAAMNGIPMHAGPVDNDGRNTLSIGRSAEAMRSFWIQMKVSDSTALGNRLSEMPEQWFTMPSESGLKNSMIATVAVFRENRLMDMHNFEEALALIELLEAEDTAVAGLYRALLTCDRMYCMLILNAENAADTVMRLQTKEQLTFMNQMKSFPTVVRTEYLLALFRGDTERAEHFRCEFEKCARKYPYAADIESERELIDIADMHYAQNR